MALLNHDIDAMKSKSAIKDAVVEVLRELGILPAKPKRHPLGIQPAKPKRNPSLRLVSTNGHKD